jgi:hypothetical protein
MEKQSTDLYDVAQLRAALLKKFRETHPRDYSEKFVRVVDDVLMHNQCLLLTQKGKARLAIMLAERIESDLDINIGRRSH